MAERKPRATKEEALKVKIEANLASQAKLVEKLEELKTTEEGLKQELTDIKNAAKLAEKEAAKAAKKAEKAAERAALKAAKAKAEKDLMKAIKKSGLSMEDVKEKLGI